MGCDSIKMDLVVSGTNINDKNNNNKMKNNNKKTPPHKHKLQQPQQLLPQQPQLFWGCDSTEMNLVDVTMGLM